MILPPAAPESESLSSIVEAAGSVAQVIVAIVAVGLALWALRIERDSVFVDRILAGLVDVLVQAREVQERYRALFGVHASKEAKLAARMAWLRERERVGMILADYATMFDEVQPVADAWEKVEAEEDSHVANQNLKMDDGPCRAAIHKYGVVHSEFATVVAGIVPKLRKRKKRFKFFRQK